MTAFEQRRLFFLFSQSESAIERTNARISLFERTKCACLTTSRFFCAENEANASSDRCSCASAIANPSGSSNSCIFITPKKVCPASDSL